jgi:hypothetical protein
MPWRRCDPARTNQCLEPIFLSAHLPAIKRPAAFMRELPADTLDEAACVPL